MELLERGGEVGGVCPEAGEVERRVGWEGGEGAEDGRRFCVQRGVVRVREEEVVEGDVGDCPVCIV